MDSDQRINRIDSVLSYPTQVSYLERQQARDDLEVLRQRLHLAERALERFVTFAQVATHRTPAGHYVWKVTPGEQQEPIVNWFGPLDFGRALEVLKAGQPASDCKHESATFDRTVCGCGEMHAYCDDCGKPLGCPLEGEA